MAETRDLFAEQTDKTETGTRAAPASVTGDVTGDAETESSASKASPEPANQPETAPDHNDQTESQTDEDPGTNQATFQGWISNTPNADGTRSVAGELYYSNNSGQPGSNRQSRTRQRKKEKGLQRVEVWVPKGTEDQIRALATEITEAHGADT